ncbi:MAG TPA: alpha/beta hydrolase [Acidimicrobiia bacterium]|nr:alpha/beta hydrolase [Acidimicrobiia bacterium]
MALWDDELEALRPQLRTEAAEFLGSWPTPVDDRAASIAERVAAQRAARVGGMGVSERAVDRSIEGPAGPIRLRTFVPDQVDAVFLHIHGGGWIIGEPEMTDLLNEIVADALHVAIVSVDYRLAPEHPYPAGPDDCEAAAVWLLEKAEAEFGTERLLIGGESAGAHLSAVTLLRMRDRHNAVDRFLGANLVFGVYDLSHTPSQQGIGVPPGGDILTVDGIRFFTELFAPGRSPEGRRDPDLSPLYADLHDLPPALFTVGAADHLVDDTLFFAQRWALAGNSSELLVYPEAPHGGIGMPTVLAHWYPRLLEFLQTCLKS